MSDTTPHQAPRLRITAAGLRLASGFVLLLFATSHLLNHTLGLVSLDALEAGRTVLMAPWHNAVGKSLLVASLALHMALGLAHIGGARSLRKRWRDWLQIVLACLIPVYLTVHVLGTAGLSTCCDVASSYERVLTVLWPGGILQQSTLVLLVWGHAAIGFHNWAHVKAFYPPLRTPLLLVAVLLPLLAILGMISGGRMVEDFQEDRPDAFAELQVQENWPDAAMVESMVHTPERIAVGVWQILVLLALFLPLARMLWLRRSRVRLVYDGGIAITAPKGLTLLEASRSEGVPHTGVCGGRGRCSTCRVRILEGGESLPPPAPSEARVLSRIDAPPDVRLACQIRPVTGLTVARLTPPERSGRDGILATMDPARGSEREIAVLFGDLRGFTALTEKRLPYDTVFILNRYAASVGQAIEGAGGRVDKFIGDGVMALFGIERAETDNGRTAREALAAARAMSLALEALNRELESHVGARLRLGIGVHIGPAIVGEMGWRQASGLTAIGDTVNVASRLEALTKDHRVELVVSQDLLDAAGLPFEAYERHETPIRGRQSGLPIAAIQRGCDLPANPDQIARAPWRRWFARAPSAP